MAKALSAAAKRALKELTPQLHTRAFGLADLLMGEVHTEDLPLTSPATIARMINETAEAIAGHGPEKSIVSISRAEDGDTIVAIVNENMPFIFDSVMAEINAADLQIKLVAHPVAEVHHDGDNFQIEDGLRRSIGHHNQGLKTSIVTCILGPATEGERTQLKTDLKTTVKQVRAAVSDWEMMRDRVSQAITELENGVLPAKKADAEETIAFLKWLDDDNFTFLGIREYDFVGGQKRGTLERSDAPALGILSDPETRILRRGNEALTTTPQIRAFLKGRDLLIVTKANMKSRVHRRTYLDYIGVKRYDKKGNLAGELRIIGLFTSTAYTRSVKAIPYLRSKIAAILNRSRHDPGSHSGKALLNALETYPRDELFQVPTADLARHADAIVALHDRPRVRVLSRPDAFDRFVSVIVFVPRERYSSDVRAKISQRLAEIYDGRVSAYYPAFPEGALARLHVIIGRGGDETPKVSAAKLEADIADIIMTWEDKLSQAIHAASDGDQTALVNAVAELDFPETYRDATPADQAVLDVQCLQQITANRPIDVDFHRRAVDKPEQAALRLYHYDTAVPLSERVPILENMGFKVISEQTFRVTKKDDGASLFIHDMALTSASGQPIDLADEGLLFERAFLSIWRGDIANDPYNGLILAAGTDATRVRLFRAYGAYMKQLGTKFSQSYMARTLARHPGFVTMLLNLFDARFNPQHEGDLEFDRDRQQARIGEKIMDDLQDVASIDEDTIIRSFADLFAATLRTNAFNYDADQNHRTTLAFKMAPQQIASAPDPKPYREIFVFGPTVEGVHLRFGPIARGGLRWSDRAEDYRTEVLGLVKAQQVKNAVIVPVGAKGGFYPKKLPPRTDRDAWFSAGRDAYVTFVSSLLSITDNRNGEQIIKPAETVCHDGDDPYLVVAADKGTATFSDTANEISENRGFWLDDAFASGGSAGYDHKKMGITARGAWEAVKRHFREMDKDIQAEEFTVVGVGDMSGDVFGNGMLLSEKIRLIAAFDHRDIFIDPDPDPATSFKERKRMFALGGSSWQDYDAKKLSKGGGIFSRNQKSITLSKPAAAAIGLDKTKASPTEIMNAILRADVELLWFGGIGTYVRASHESDAEVGDRTNDAIRVTAKQVGASVIGEGANLGITQPARVEFCQHGGRCNSDAIDNSGGVNSSDVEVNIKIALQPALADQTLSRGKRDWLLENMTDSVAELVLKTNYDQTLAISRAERAGATQLQLQNRLMQSLEARGLLDRKIEDLPDEDAIVERLSDKQGLTRPEIGVLVSYSKLVLYDDLVASDLPDDPHLETTLLNYFPPRMQKAHGELIGAHRLRREIIATQIANEVVNRGGPSVISRFEDATGLLPSVICRSHIVARDGLAIDSIQEAIDGLDNKISGDTQLMLYGELAEGLRQAIAHHLKAAQHEGPIAQAVDELSSARKELAQAMRSLLPDYLVQWSNARRVQFEADGLPKPAADALAMLPLNALLPDMVDVAKSCDMDLLSSSDAFFRVTETFKIGRLEHQAYGLDTSDYFDGLAQQRALDTIHTARRTLTAAALRAAIGDRQNAVAQWVDANTVRIKRVQDRIAGLTEGGELTASRLTVAAGLLADLAEG
ncbi:MAG: NAD-glutamate dehydrogenase [Pseudomonadota bacterium]